MKKERAPKVAKVASASVVKPKTKKEKKAERKALKDAKIASGVGVPKRTTGGLHKLMRLSSGLGELLGMKEASRSEVVSELWKYIKSHNLQNPTDRRHIVLDSPMTQVFGVPELTMFTINKALTAHLTPAAVQLSNSNPNPANPANPANLADLSERIESGQQMEQSGSSERSESSKSSKSSELSSAAASLVKVHASAATSASAGASAAAGQPCLPIAEAVPAAGGTDGSAAAAASLAAPAVGTASVRESTV